METFRSFEYNGITIEVTKYGEFVAVMGDVEIKTDTLAAARLNIDAEQKSSAKQASIALKVCFAQSIKGKLQIIRTGLLTGVNRTTRALNIEGADKDSDCRMVIPDTEANRTLLAAYLEAFNRATALKAAIDKMDLRDGVGYGRIDADKYSAVLEAISAKYGRAIAAELVGA